MANIDSPNRSAHQGVNSWLLPMMLTALLALGGWIAKEVVDHNSSLAEIKGTLGEFNRMLERVVPDLSKVSLDFQHEKDRSDEMERHLEYNDKAIDSFRQTNYLPVPRRQ